MGAIANTAANGKNLRTFASYIGDNDAKPGAVVQVTFPPESLEEILLQVETFHLPNVLILKEYGNTPEMSLKNKLCPFTDVIAVLPSDEVEIGELLDSIEQPERIRMYLLDNSTSARNYAPQGVDLDKEGLVRWEGEQK